MEINLSKSEIHAFSGDILLVESRDGEEKYFMLVEDDEQDDLDNSTTLHFVDLQNGISYKRVYGRHVNVRFEDGYTIKDLGVILKVIPSHSVVLSIKE